MIKIKTTGVEDYLDGSANIKALIIGGPGAGKTRSSSFWPKPIYLDCENGRGSLVDRKMPYAEVKSSKDMLDALDYLKTLERTPKAQRQFQTVVIDTVDSFQRIVKEEWVTNTKAGSFSGFDAWGYLDTKMQLLFTRLLNLDYNVVVLVHFKDKTYKDGDNTIRELTLQLQGAISDIIFNDFGLVGWLGTYWEAGENGQVQKRGLTFHPTPDKPFLKDRFHVTPKWLPIEFTERDYQQLWEAFFDRPEFEEFAESEVVGEIPDSVPVVPAPQVAGPVALPHEGGPVARPDAQATADPVRSDAPAEVPLEKKTNAELQEIAKGLGLTPKGNALKSELVNLIKAKRAQAEEVKAEPKPPEPEVVPDPTSAAPSASGSSNDASPASPGTSTPSAEPSAKPEASPAPDSGSPSSSQDPWSPPSAQPADSNEALDAAAEARVAEQLGGEVISETPADTPATTPPSAPPAPAPQQPARPQGPSACAECGGDLAPEWADPAKKNAVRLSFVKFRRYLCSGCYAAAS